MILINTRCTWCRRLCLYFGEDQYHHLCECCQLWHSRNQCCHVKNALCFNNSNTPGDANLLVIVRTPVLWARVLDMNCGSIHELDNHVQVRIWKRILCGLPPSNLILLERSGWLWKFWTLNVWGRSQKLVPQYNDNFRYTRVLYIVIACLGPFSEFWVAHGSSWNRGWRYV